MLPVLHGVETVLITSFVPIMLSHSALCQTLQDVDSSDEMSDIKLRLYFLVGRSDKFVTSVTLVATFARHSELEEETALLLDIFSILN